MSEEDFEVSCELVREQCRGMSEMQIAILVGLLIHDEEERRLNGKKTKEAKATA